MIKVEEVYERQLQSKTEEPDGSLYVGFSKVYEAHDALVNPDYMVSIRPHEFSSSLERAKLEKNFSPSTKFCTLILDGNSFRTSEMIVVGSFEKFSRKLGDK